jgi:hypothetical protein
LPRENEENHEEIHSAQLVPRPKFETGIFRVKGRTVSSCQLGVLEQQQHNSETPDGLIFIFIFEKMAYAMPIRPSVAHSYKHLILS